MKVFAKFLLVSVVVSLVAGCASDVVFIPKVPQAAQAKLLDYNEQPGNKAFILAVDAGGDYAFGYDYGKATLKEAVEAATKKCDASREAHRISAKPYIYALNDVVVYEDMIRQANKSDAADEMEVQQAEAAKQDAEGSIPPAAE